MSKIIKCIFCLKDKQESDEHVFPDGLGGQLIIKEVCKGCNDYLGKEIDTHLVNNLLMQFARFLYKIPGKKGILPNPIGKGVLETEPDREVYYKFDKEGNPQSLYLVPQKIEADDGTSISFSVDASDENKLAGMINKTLERKGLPTMSKEEVLENGTRQIIDKPKILVNAEFNFNSYRKAILKIIYELSYYFLGPNFLEDPLAEIIRNYIKSSKLEVQGLKGSIGLVKETGSNNQIFRQLAIDHGHIAVMLKDQNKIYCYVNIFNKFEGTFLVSERAQNYKDFKNIFIENDVVKKSVRENSFNEEIENFLE